MRIPWLIVGTLGGLVAFGLLLPAISDVHGFAVIWCALFCLVGGLLVGFFIDGGRDGPQPPGDDRTQVGELHGKDS
jgi:hypothetical protein